MTLIGTTLGQVRIAWILNYIFSVTMVRLFFVKWISNRVHWCIGVLSLASIARKIYLRGGLGVGAFRRIYGGSKRNGSRPRHFGKSSGAVARHILQQLEQMKIVEIDPRGWVGYTLHFLFHYTPLFNVIYSLEKNMSKNILKTLTYSMELGSWITSEDVVWIRLMICILNDLHFYEPQVEMCNLFWAAYWKIFEFLTRYFVLNFDQRKENHI